MVIGLGTVSSQPRVLADGSPKAFAVPSLDYCELPVPHHNSVVWYVGRLGDKGLGSGLRVDLESNELNVGVQDSRQAKSSAASWSKRRNIQAVVLGQRSEMRGGGDRSQIDFDNSRIFSSPDSSKRIHFASHSLKETHDAGLLRPQSVLDYATRQCPSDLPPHSLSIYVGGVYPLIGSFSLGQDLVKTAEWRLCLFATYSYMCCLCR
ncbi:hypothetical protein EDD16DRAFT_1705894 [Pisolithus croceorrhizus]|nr:hypothetical protein EDD16DRAFT_1705894 [Pisolithus croceorrhizus]KAI6168445.1 hypothetical protein EDD17DRAFT_1749958 [Pisolithus thermaeus]